MPTVAVYDIKNQQVGDIELNENIFGVEVNAGLLHQAVVMQLASQRLGNLMYGSHSQTTSPCRASISLMSTSLRVSMVDC